MKSLPPTKSPWAAVSSLYALISEGPLSAPVLGPYVALGMLLFRKRFPGEWLPGCSDCVGSLALRVNTGLLEAASIPISSPCSSFGLAVQDTVAD